MSAEAAILDQIGQKDEARQNYRKALDLKPNEPSILSNLGMSYVLEGDLHTAETYMRSAAQQPNADSRVRQNLALVVGLQGRFDEAEQIASAGAFARTGAGQCRLSAPDAGPAERLEPDEGPGQGKAGDQLSAVTSRSTADHPP